MFARPNPKRRRLSTVFVLAGGASHGAVQLGMLRALSRADVNPDQMIGTSIGALNAAVACQDELSKSIPLLEAVWEEFADQPRKPNLRRLASSLLARSESLSLPVSRDERLHRQLKTPLIEDTHIPLGIVATSLSTGQERLFLEGDIASAVRASCAVPGIFPPVWIDNDRFVDGLLFGPPIDHAVRVGATRIFILGTGQVWLQDVHSPSWYGIARRSATLMTLRYYHRSIELAQQVAEVVILPAPEEVRTVSRRDFRSTQKLVTLGESVAWRFLQSRRSGL